MESGGRFDSVAPRGQGENRMLRSARRKAVLALLTVVGATAMASQAYAVTFTFSSGTRAASADFAIAGSTLTLTLTNTYVGDGNVPTDMLTAVFFKVPNTTATRTSVVLAAGSTVYYDPDGQPAGGVVGGEYAYKGGLSVGDPNDASAPTANAGVSSVGLGLFGPGDRFPGADLQSPASPDGLQYGLLPAGWVTTGDNGGVTGSGGLIKNAVVATLSNITFAEADISAVYFQYGTALNEPRYPGGKNGGGGGTDPEPDPVPEPATLGLSLLSAAALGWATHRRRQR